MLNGPDDVDVGLSFPELADVFGEPFLVLLTLRLRLNVHGVLGVVQDDLRRSSAIVLFATHLSQGGSRHDANARKRHEVVHVPAI